MRTLVAVVIFGAVVAAGSVKADPLAKVGFVGGLDESAPGGHDDGYTFGAGYMVGGFTALAEYSYFDYDGSTGVGGYAHHAALVGQARLATLPCRNHSHCPHFDLDAGVGRRWVHWTPGERNGVVNLDRPIEHDGRELQLGVSVTAGFRFALHYMIFHPDAATQMFSCRGTCPMQTTGDSNGLMFDVAWLFGDDSH